MRHLSSRGSGSVASVCTGIPASTRHVGGFSVLSMYMFQFTAQWAMCGGGDIATWERVGGLDGRVTQVCNSD
eukprot:1588217-Rhodomonas_salina.1